jgi:hypothetical protein
VKRLTRDLVPPHQAGEFIVNQADIAQRMSRALGMDGSELPQSIDKKHNAGIQVEDLTHPEYWWLRRGLRYGVGWTQAAVAAQFSFVEVYIRTSGARKLVVLEKVIISNPGPALLFVEVGFGGAVAVGATREPAPLDDRFGNPAGAPAGSGIQANVGTSAAPVRPGVGIQLVVGINASVDIGPIIMTGNANFTVIGTIANTALGVTIFTKERPLLDTER